MIENGGYVISSHLNLSTENAAINLKYDFALDAEVILKNNIFFYIFNPKSKYLSVISFLFVKNGLIVRLGRDELSVLA